MPTAEAPPLGPTLDVKRAAIVLFEFAVHVVLGTVLFCIVGAPAVGLNVLVHRLPEWGVESGIVYLLVFTEYCLLVGDILLFLAFMIVTSARAIRSF